MAFQALARLQANAVALSGSSKQTDTRRDHAYDTRIKYLRELAVEDGYSLNLASEIDFRQFIRSAPEIRRGNLVLMDNGNLRAIWKDDKGNHLGLQFLGGRMVQYVVFKHRGEDLPFSRVAGT